MTMAINNDPNAKWWLKSVPEVNTWSDDNVLRFLRYYQIHPVLWNARNPHYKSVCSRLRAYKHIVELLNLRGVNVNECMKLVEWLKKKYTEEKEIRRPKSEKRPAWFEIIRKIIIRILNPDDEDTHSCECCKQCCTCESSSESTTSSDFQACKDCCADQNLHPPCEYYKSSDKDEDSNRCNFEKVECYTMCNDEVQVVVLNIGDKLRKYHSDCDCTTNSSDARNSDRDCKSENSKGSEKSVSTCTCCKSESLPSVPKSSSSEDASSCKCRESSTTNSIPSVSSVAQFCIQPMPTPSETSSCNTCSTIDDGKKAGIFMDSQQCRFRGKRISLVDEYVSNECGILEAIKPRLHLARCCCDSDSYPVQVEL